MRVAARYLGPMATDPIVRIGTRGSDLALWQAHYLQNQLLQHGTKSELVIIKTQGDRIQHLSLDKLEGKGFFTKELEDALLAGEVQVAVHSMKDLPTTMPPGLVLGGVSERADPTDWLLVAPSAVEEGKIWKLREGARVGTSSARRKAQLLDLRSDLNTVDIRGNVPTRVQKLREGQFDGIVLAAAGLTRLDLDLSDLHVVELHPHEFVPAPAQGVLAYQCSEQDVDTRRLLAKIHVVRTARCTNVERSLLQSFDGGCHLPLGAHCVAEHGAYTLHAAYAPSATAPLVRRRLSYSTFDGLAEDMKHLLEEAVAA